MEWILLTAMASITNIQLRRSYYFQRRSSPREIIGNPAASSDECRLCNAKRGEQRWHASAYEGIETDNSRL